MWGASGRSELLGLVPASVATGTGNSPLHSVSRLPEALLGVCVKALPSRVNGRKEEEEEEEEKEEKRTWGDYLPEE